MNKVKVIYFVIIILLTLVQYGLSLILYDNHAFKFKANLLYELII